VKVTLPVGLEAPDRVAVSEAELPNVIEPDEPNEPVEPDTKASAIVTHAELPLQVKPTPNPLCAVVTD
jgi:hypothetical protein